MTNLPKSTSTPLPTNQRDKLLRRLQPYWRMEAANVVVVPLLAWFLITVVFKGVVTLAVALSMAANSFLLVIGAFAWKMVVDGLLGNPETEKNWTPWLAMARWPALLFTAAAIVATAIEAIATLPKISPSLVGSGLLCLLAVLEYVNYYHVQVQHFDHWKDFHRLLSGKGFRKSHLAKSIQAMPKSNGRN